MRDTLEETLARTLRPLSLDDVLALAKAGAVLLDVRPAQPSARRTSPGSVNVALGGRYATWAGTLLDRTRPIVLVGDPGAQAEAATRLARIGFDHVAGHLDDLMGGAARPSRPPAAGPEGLAGRPPRAHGRRHGRRLVIDVRAAPERDQGHVPGSVNLPLPRLLAHLDRVPRDREVVVHCQSGYRSSIAASLLAREGYANVSDLVGGWVSFDAARAPAFPEP